MKTIIFTGFFGIILSVTAVAQQSGYITTEKKGLKKIYLYDGENIDKKQLAEHLRLYPESAMKYKRSGTCHIVGLSSIGVATAFFGVGLYYEIKAAQATNGNNLKELTDYENKSVNNILIGTGFLLVSVPFFIISHSQLNKSIELYNNSQTAGKNTKVILYCGFTKEGVGFTLEF